MRRQDVERGVFKDVMQGLLDWGKGVTQGFRSPGYVIDLDTGDNFGAWAFKGKGSRNLDEIMAAAFGPDDSHCDEWYVVVVEPSTGLICGQLFCVAGNEGYNLFASYSESLTDVVKPIVERWEIKCETI